MMRQGDAAMAGEKLGKVDRRWLERLKRLEERDPDRCLPVVVSPPYGHRCAVCQKPVDRGHPLHRVTREQPGSSVRTLLRFLR